MVRGLKLKLFAALLLRAIDSPELAIGERYLVEPARARWWSPESKSSRTPD